jgi:hypothetical protein
LWPATWGWRPPASLRAFGLIPIIRVVGDVAKMLGYPAGLLWRWRIGSRLSVVRNRFTAIGLLFTDYPLLTGYSS